MRSNVPFTWSLIILGGVGVLFSSILVLFIILDFSSQTSYTRTAASTILQVPRPGLPVRLIIPAIGVDAPLEDVGLTPDGAMAVPAGPVDAAWFELGPRPGEVGSAVIAGHEGWKNNIPAVFDNLHELQAGNKIYVEDATGTTTTFIVRSLQTYDQNENVPEVFYSRDGKVHLNLITCEGIWNAALKSYSSRIVVFADAGTE